MTTASLHREMVEALRRVSDTLAAIDNPYRLRTDRWAEWERRRLRDLAEARAALEGWEKRPRLRDDEALERAVYLALFGGQTDTQDFFDQATLDAMRTEVVRRVLDVLEPLLYGERG